MTLDTPSLTWSSQLSVTPLGIHRALHGDKIILPEAVLQALLSAAPVTEQSLSQAFTSDFDPYNPHSFAAERQARQDLVERQQQLPHPLTFRLVNPDNGHAVYAGIREFSAPPDEIGLSLFLRQALGLEDGKILKRSERVTIHAQQLQKGTYVRLRPLAAGYDPEDWKSLLERYLRDNFTTLTNGEILTVTSGKDDFRFLIDKLQPDGPAICVVDTDLEVDIEPLNEEQARDTLKQRAEKLAKAPGTRDGSSVGGAFEFGKEAVGQVRPGEYVDYTLNEWERLKGIDVELAPLDGESDVDLFIAPRKPTLRIKPREEEYVFADYSGRPSKRIKISHTNTEINNANAIYISVRSNKGGSEEPNKTQPVQYTLRVAPLEDASKAIGVDIHMADEPSDTAKEEVRCKNCHQWVPQRTMVLHESFCYRNNVLCPKCQNVFKKSSDDWKNHWHCPHDDSYGNSLAMKEKHDTLLHTPRTCADCGYVANNIPELAHHRTSVCPAKHILCQFCHLLVPQKGPDDPDPSDPDVVFSGLTPHEIADGARTTECHLCSKIIRIRDMSTHLRHHDLERLSRHRPRICHNANCGRTIDGIGRNGQVKREADRNDLGFCDACFAPLYASMYDSDGKALRRRVERRYLTQLLTGCGTEWCRNEYCKTGRKNLGIDGQVSSKEALSMIKPLLEGLGSGQTTSYFCTGEASQKRRVLAEMIAAERQGSGKGKGRPADAPGYDIAWCIASLEVSNGDLDGARAWLSSWAPTRAEEGH